MRPGLSQAYKGTAPRVFGPTRARVGLEGGRRDGSFLLTKTPAPFRYAVEILYAGAVSCWGVSRWQIKIHWILLMPGCVQGTSGSLTMLPVSTLQPHRALSTTRRLRLEQPTERRRILSASR